MKPWLIAIIILFVLAILIFVRVRFELTHLIVRHYTVTGNGSCSSNSIRLVLLADLHGRIYGETNQKLVRIIEESNPDYILISGDMVTANVKKDDKVCFDLLNSIKDIAPCIYAPGNHEKKLEENPNKFINRFSKIMDFVKSNNIIYLSNKKIDLSNDITVYGLDLNTREYKNNSKVSCSFVKEKLGEIDKNKYNILLAHTPGFFKEYVKLGMNLVLSGHYHGGAVRIPNGPGLISPQFVLFPKYSAGKFTEGKTTMIVSAGCGSHSVNLRLFNRPEVVVIDLI